MKNLINLAMITFASITFYGCASTAAGKAFNENKSLHYHEGDNAKVVVFRPDRITAMGDTIHIIADGKNHGEILPVGYVAFDIELKKQSIHTDSASIDRQYVLKPEKGLVYYFEMDFDNYAFASAWDLEPISKEKALEDMSELKNSKSLNK